MLKKRTFIVFAIIFMVVFNTIIVKAEENLSENINISSESCVLMEQSTGEILYENNSHKVLPPASITKIMTLLLIYEAEKDGRFKWEDMVTVSEHASSMGGSQVFLEPNEQQTAADLTKCIAIASANDAAVAMAEFIGSSEEAFVKMMNERAAELGMTDTVFKNACGLDTDGHVSSAYDIALMSRELMKSFPEIQKYTTTWQDTIVHKTRKGESEFGLTNTNKLIKWYNGATGLKTGSTGKAKYCLSATANRNGMNLIAVIMAAPDNKARFQEAMKLLNYGFSLAEIKTVAKKGEFAENIPVEKGIESSVQTEYAEDVNVLIKKGENKDITVNLDIPEKLTAPIEKGDVIGTAYFLSDENEVGKTDIICSKGIEKADIIFNFKYILSIWA